MLRFHWRLPEGGERGPVATAVRTGVNPASLPDLGQQTEFCQRAEEAGLDSLLLNFGFGKPDPILLTAALGAVTQRIKFIIAIRSGLIVPTFFVQQLNTLSALVDGRFSLNIVAGHSPDEQRGYGDFLAHDERYARTEEFLAVCHAFWGRKGPVGFSGDYYRIEGGTVVTPFVSPEASHPELYIAGGSETARALTVSQGSCWLTLAEPPERLAPRIPEVLRHGRTVGIRASVIVRPTRAEAVEAARALAAGSGEGRHRASLANSYTGTTDSVSISATADDAGRDEWLTPYLWTGTVRTMGPATISLVGSVDEVVDALLDYKRIGVTQFVLSGEPKLEEMVFFGREVIPRVREREGSVAAPTPHLQST